LDAAQVPWVVIPQSFFESKKVPPNALSAVICDGKLFYGIMGDTDADNPEVIGEASLLLGNTCFPKEGLNGGSGHDALDVLCTAPQLHMLTVDIVFMIEFKAVNDTSITDFNALRNLGDQNMAALIKTLGPGKARRENLRLIQDRHLT
jgi:chitosanase